MVRYPDLRISAGDHVFPPGRIPAWQWRRTRWTWMRT